jgi:hypothetical protein
VASDGSGMAAAVSSAVNSADMSIRSILKGWWLAKRKHQIASTKSQTISKHEMGMTKTAITETGRSRLGHCLPS